MADVAESKSSPSLFSPFLETRDFQFYRSATLTADNMVMMMLILTKSIKSFSLNMQSINFLMVCHALQIAVYGCYANFLALLEQAVINHLSS
ncbi:MAG: hypothetical protein LKF41_07545 [Bifidobacterium sp.]|jgi:hypothetical protein|nr:hypothetical protein [Bifidobacterium sp.]MCH4175695.1 hypothetical protein [Bifidobacterium sp.]